MELLDKKRSDIFCISAFLTGIGDFLFGWGPEEVVLSKNKRN